MSCRFCLYAWQYVINWLNLGDHALNALFLGDSDETLSARIARARIAGRPWAVTGCDILSWGVKIVTIGNVDRDHCAHALDDSRPISREIWNWSTNTLNPVPVSEVRVIEDPDPK